MPAEKAKEYAQQWENLKSFAEAKVARLETEISEFGIGTKVEKFMQKLSGFLYDRKDYANVATTPQEYDLQITKAALDELPHYKTDCDKYKELQANSSARVNEEAVQEAKKHTAGVDIKMQESSGQSLPQTYAINATPTQQRSV